ncbi:MAG: hypothetical protein E7016_04070 [Alphaproteobacteria bacterium]|nr:hypothetical protein [Alphaproteobacteria bacterium]
MSNKNLEAFEQMRKLTKEAKKFYADNYNPGSLYPPRDTKFFLNEEYIPFDFETDYDDPLYKEYRRVRMLQDPFEDTIERQDITHEQAQKDLKEQLQRAEKKENYPYLDWNNAKNKTFCYGHKETQEKSFANHPWKYFDGSKACEKNFDKCPDATPQQIRDGFYDLGNSYKHNHVPRYYKGKTKLRLPDEYCNELLDKDIQTRYDELSNYKWFRQASPSLQAAAQEVYFTSGFEGFPKALNFAKEKKQKKFCEHLHRKDDRDENMKQRNEWVDNYCRRGYFYDW